MSAIYIAYNTLMSDNYIDDRTFKLKQKSDNPTKLSFDIRTLGKFIRDYIQNDYFV